MNRQETLADVLADLRKWGTRHYARSAKIREFCDRLIAAYRREKEHPMCFRPGEDCAERLLDGSCANPCVSVGGEGGEVRR